MSENHYYKFYNINFVNYNHHQRSLQHKVNVLKPTIHTGEIFSTVPSRII